MGSRKLRRVEREGGREGGRGWCTFGEPPVVVEHDDGGDEGLAWREGGREGGREGRSE